MGGIIDDCALALNRIRAHSLSATPPEYSWYGLHRPLKEWAGLPPDMPIAMEMHHFVEMRIEAAPTYVASRNPIIVARPDFKRFYEERYGKPAVAAGTPYVHYRRLRGITSHPDAQGTIAFPAHSTHHIRTSFDVDAYIDQLQALPEPFQPVAVCLYWKDVLDGMHRRFQERGVPVHTAGHLFDQDFCANLYDILSRFRFSTSNRLMGSSAILALEMGLPFFVLGPPVHYTTDGGDPNRVKPRYDEDGIIGECDDPLALEYCALVPRYRPGMGPQDIEPSPRLKAIATTIHGCDDALNPEEVRRAIFGSCFVHGDGRPALDFVFANRHLLNGEKHEIAFADMPTLLSCCRALTAHPELLSPRPIGLSHPRRTEAMPLAVTREQDLVEHLEALGVHRGARIVAHSHLVSFGLIDGGVETVLKALRRVIGDRGCLIVPTYTLTENPEEPFDPRHSPSQSMGALSEQVRGLPEAVRSRSPMHSHAGVGSGADLLAAGVPERSFGAGSDFDLMDQADFLLLLLGCDFQRGATFLHHMEAVCQVPYRRWVEVPRRVRRLDGSIQTVVCQYFGRLPEQPVQNDFSRIQDEAVRRGIARRVMLPYGASFIVRLRELRDLASELLAEDPYALVHRP